MSEDESRGKDDNALALSLSLSLFLYCELEDLTRTSMAFSTNWRYVDGREAHYWSQCVIERLSSRARSRGFQGLSNRTAKVRRDDFLLTSLSTDRDTSRLQTRCETMLWCMRQQRVFFFFFEDSCSPALSVYPFEREEHCNSHFDICCLETRPLHIGFEIAESVR